MFKELYSNYGDLKAMSEAMEGTPELEVAEDTQGYTVDQLYDIGGAKQAAIDEHNMKLERTNASMLGGIAGNWLHNTGTGMLLNKAFQDVGQEEDPEFDLNLAQTSVEPLLMSKDHQETLSRAKNQNHFNIIADNLRDYENHKLNMEKLGTPLALLTQLGSEGFNLVNYVPFLRAFGITKMKTTANVLTAATLQGALNAGEEGIINKAYNDRSVSSYIAAFGMGAGFVGGIATAGKVWNTKAEMRMGEASDNADIFGATKLEDHADEVLNTARHGARVDRDYTNSAPKRNVNRELDPRVEKDLVDNGYDPTSEVDIVVRDYEKQGLVPKATAVPQEKIGLAGFAQTLARSDNVHTRYNNRVLFEHGEGNYGFHKEHTAALEAEIEYYRLMSGYGKNYIEAKGVFGDLGKNSGIAMEEFDRLMYKYMDQGHQAVDKRLSPEMIKVMDDFQEVFITNKTSVGKHVQEAGTEEFQNGLWKDSTMHRKYDPQAFYDLTQKMNDGGEGIKIMLEESINRAGGFKKASDARIKEVTDIYNAKIKEFDAKTKELQSEIDGHKAAHRTEADFTKKIQAEARLDKAIRRMEAHTKTKAKLKLPDIDTEDLTRGIAESVYNRMYNRSITNRADANLFSSNNQNLLMESLKDGKMSKERLDHVKAILDTMGKDNAANPFADQIKMDMSVTRVVNGEEISMLDLLDVDLAQGYATTQKYWIGRAAMARKGDHFRSEAEIHNTLNRGAQRGLDAGLDSKQVQKELKLQQEGVNMILGQPIQRTDTASAKAMRVMRKLVAVSSLGKLGIVQAGETGRMIGAVEAQYRIPMIKDLVQGVLTGKMDVASLKGIEDFVVGDIADRVFMNHPDFRADDFGAKAGRKEKALDSLGYHLSKASGWNRIHKMQNKGMVNYLSQMWYRQIMDGTMPRTQMNDLGVSDLLMKDIKAEMTKHAYPVEGLTNKKTIMELGFEEWEPGVRRKFGMMLHRKSTNAIQDINVGETPMWLNTEIGKFVGQFRTFSVAALSKQTTRDYKMLREGDMEGAVSMAFNMGTSVMANVVKVGFVAATLPALDREGYLEKALSPASIANQILSYTGPLSPLVEAANLVGDTTFGDAYGDIMGSKMGFRARGLSSIVPSLAYANKAYKGISGLSAAALTDKEASRSDYKALYSTLPFSNNYAFEAVNNRILIPSLFNEE